MDGNPGYINAYAPKADSASGSMEMETSKMAGRVVPLMVHFTQQSPDARKIEAREARSKRLSERVVPMGQLKSVVKEKVVVLVSVKK